MFGKNEIVGQKYFKDANDRIMVTSMFMTLQGEGPYRGEPAFFVRFSKCNLACSFCFVKGTQIAMSSGRTKDISEIQIGDSVVSYNGKTNQFEHKSVTKLYNSKTEKLIRIITASKNSRSLPSNKSQKIYTTPEHPFLVKGKGWVEAQYLKEDDILIHFSNSERMKLMNPRNNPEVSDKLNVLLRTDSYRLSASKKMAETQSRPDVKAALIDRMTKNNPMKDPSVALKAFLSKEKGEKTGAEKRFELACSGLPLEYTGDGALVVSHKIPDFKVIGQKKLIEVWSADALHAKDRDDDWKQKRAEIFAKEGYETLFIPMPPSGVKNGLYDSIRKEVAEFINNGETVTKIDVIERSNDKAWVRLAGSSTNECDVFNFEVEDNHTYVANGKVVHNCDTYFDSGDWLTIDELHLKIIMGIHSYFGDINGELTPEWADIDSVVDGKIVNKKRKMALVITGGEPMLQKSIVPFLSRMNKEFAVTQIESNGLIYQELPKETTLVVSPKCHEKNGISVKYLEPNKQVLDRADCLKFVMCAEPESPYSSIPDWGHQWAKDTGKPVFISPMNIYNSEPEASKKLRAGKNDISIEERSTVDEVISFWTPGLLNLEQNQRNHEHTARFCIKHGYTFNLQQHLYASVA